MSTPRLVELAKEGHPQAIARLINQQLASRGITAVASRQGSCLRLLLEAPKQPNQTMLVPYVCRALTKLGSPAIQQVDLYGRKQGEARGWQVGLSQVDRQFILDKGLSETGSSQADLSETRLSEACLSEARLSPTYLGQSKPAPSQNPLELEHSLYDESHHGGSRLLSQTAAAQRRRAERAKFAASVPDLETDMDSMDSLEQAMIQSPKPARRKRPPRRYQSRAEPQLPRLRQSRSARPWRKSQRPLPPQTPVQSQVAQKRQPWIIFKSVGLWLGWQWAAWSTTLLLAIISVPIAMLALFSVFSLLNRFEEQFMVLFSLGCLAFVPLLGLLLGHMQTRLLRKRLHNIGGWRWMTMLGMVLGVAIAVGSHFAIATLFAPVVSDPDPEFVIGRGLPFVASTLGVGFGCLILGFFQWLMISTSITKSYLWLLATSVGSIISWIAGMLISATWIGPRFFPAAADPSNFWSTLFLWMAGGLVSWLLFHALSGTVMAALLRDLPRLDQPSEHWESEESAELRSELETSNLEPSVLGQEVA